MPLSSSSLAAAVGAAIDNVQFKSLASVLSRKILVIGTYDPTFTTITDEVPVLVTSAEDAADKFGAGFMIHRLVKQAFVGSNGVECWVQPQSEAGGAAASAGDIDFATSNPTVSGTVHLYVAGIPVPFAILDTDTADDIATKCAAAVTADATLPVDAVVNGVTTSQVDFTAKSKGPWGDEISLSFNWGFQEELPDGVVAAITDMTGGSGIPTISNALDGLGTGDDQNEKFFTDVLHGYGQDTTTLDALSNYNGAGDLESGNYAKTVARPFRVLDGDTVADSAGLNALVALADLRKTDRTNGIIAVPGSPNHPAEIAAIALGVMAKLNNNRAEESYVGQILTGVYAGALADRWTSSYDSRDTAVKAGVSPTVVDSGIVVMQNVLTFYRPDSVPITSNIYRSQRNISITQNLLNSVKLNFSQSKWQGITIVEDVFRVTSSISRQKARDINSVLDDLLALAASFRGNAWIYTDAFTIERLQAGGLIEIRPGATGFNITLPVLYSGEGGIIDTLVQGDTSLAVLG